MQLPMRLVHGGRRGCRYAYEKNILQTANLLLCFDTYKSMETCAALQHARRHTPLLNSERATWGRAKFGKTRGGGFCERAKTGSPQQARPMQILSGRGAKRGLAKRESGRGLSRRAKTGRRNNAASKADAMQVLLPPNARDLAQRHLVPRVQRVPLSAAAVATRCTCARRACWSLVPVQACACVVCRMQRTPVTQHATQRLRGPTRRRSAGRSATVGCTRVLPYSGGRGWFGAAAAAFGGRSFRRRARPSQSSR